LGGRDELINASAVAGGVAAGKKVP
jgi:hypothetical protein